MTSLPDRQRRTMTWIVIGVVAVLAGVATLLTINLLTNLPSGASPSATESLVASATSGPSATPLASTSASSTPVANGASGWRSTGSMIEARFGYTATLLQDGKVLVAGGGDSSGPLASAELYDPSSGSWTATGNMVEARNGHTATLLPDGTVLVAGGHSCSNCDADPLASAELYDPGSGTWTPTGSMIEVRAGHTVTLLLDGRVLAAGGYSSTGDGGPLGSAELYDPSSGTWSPTGNMVEVRTGRGASLLPDGRVLVAGGYDSISGTVASAELYDPSSGTWSPTGNMVESRDSYTATLLPDGRVLVAGGISISISDGSGVGGTVASAELYDPSSGSWTATGNMIEARAGHTFALLPDGRVLVAGGYSTGITIPGGAEPVPVASAELYDPSSGSWTTIGEMIEVRADPTLTLLRDGTVLVAGGLSGGAPAGDPLASAELYDPGRGS